VDILTVAELTKFLLVPGASRELAEVAAGGAIVVVLDETHATELDDALRVAVETLPHPLVGVFGEQPPESTRSLADLVDVALSGASAEAGLARLLERIAARPLASAALAVLLRGAARRSVGQGLAAESAVYSMLQAGPEFQAWLAARPAPRQRDNDMSVLVNRTGETLRITLFRPEMRNAFNARMREELLDALAVAAADPSIASVVLDGEGPSFCSGGDLDEFGTAPDPATAHVVRLGRSAGAAIYALAPRVTAQIHGACFGAGIELPAFAGRVVARADTVIALPEVGMGLIPGAGGTVSLPRRIGRQRTAFLALSGARVDARAALAFGLVDEVEEE